MSKLIEGPYVIPEWPIVDANYLLQRADKDVLEDVYQKARVESAKYSMPFPDGVPRKELCYRVETVDGISMYHVGCSFHEADRHPAPRHDAKLRDFYRKHMENYGSPYFFGFSSMEQLRRWVYRDQQYLVDRGLMISIYQTDDYCIGDTQMVFRKKTAVLIGRASLI